MKKNKMMRAASILMVATLLTTSVISGTFAKYVTSGNASDEARVAKFGVEIRANGTMFAKEYVTNDSNVSGTIAKSVISSDDSKNVLAPGTSGDLFESTITGTPEVAVNVKREATLTLTGWEDESGAYYCPIIITVDGSDYSGLNYSSIENFKQAVETAINADTKNYAPGTNLSGITADTLDVTWKWDFYSSVENDVKDTYLGDQAAEGNASTIKLEVVTTVTQID